ncbi:MAG: hypothetical protein R3B54_00930 [Bdellovibrionota bacterium]
MMDSIQQNVVVRKLAPEVFRQRFVIEGYFDREIRRDDIEVFFREVCKELGLRAYGDPIIFTPGTMGKEENQGFDAFIPLIDSGISLYVWSKAKFFSAVFFTCKGFDEAKASAFTKKFMNAGDCETFAF